MGLIIILLLAASLFLFIRFLSKKDYINNFINSFISLKKIETILKILQYINILSIILGLIFFFTLVEKKMMTFEIFISYILGLFTLSCGILLIHYILRNRS